MICPECNGTKGFWRSNEDGTSDLHDCPACGGKGVVDPMTNEEWLRAASTEQLAECITNISFNTGYDSYNVVYRKMVEWLKQPHTDKE